MSGKVTVHNPYWDAVKDRVTASQYTWDHTPQIERFRFDAKFDEVLAREDFVHRYSWSVPDPQAIAFVVEHGQHDGLVDPMAGSGYWAYILGQVGVEVVCYDRDPTASNHWHPTGELWSPVEAMPCHESVTKHPDRVLFLSWPPYSEPAGEQAVRNYEGQRIILLGEGNGGCTGNEGMFDLLDTEWNQVASHPLIQWWGVHDDITVHERRGR